jgi:hypothetical protein
VPQNAAASDRRAVIGHNSRRDLNAEARIQAAVVAYIRTVAPGVLVFHVANGGLRTPREAARLKWQGVVAGVPDLVIVAPGGRTRFLEIKTETGRLSKEQIDMFDRLAAFGTEPLVCRGIDDARRALAAWGIATREVRYERSRRSH